MNKIISLIVISALLTSCASILNSKYQKIAIQTDSKSVVLINGEKGKTKKGRYLVQRDRKPKQITIQREGYKDENIVIMQYKKSPLYIMSWIPFALLIYPPYLDKGPKSYNYDKELIVDTKLQSIVNKSGESKEIRVNNTSIKLEENNIKNRYFPTYKNYLRKETKREAKTSENNEEINIENSIFSDALNKLLKEKGYIDTTNKVLKSSYLNNLFINSNISSYTINHIANYHYSSHGGMIYIDLAIDWEILDFYKKPIHKKTTKSSSGQFAIQDYEDMDEVIHNSIKDAIEIGFIKLMDSKEIKGLLQDKSELALEKSFEEITIPKATSYVSNLSQAIKSSVTIKGKKGHGSGFIISDNGYVVTNYHVVSDTSKSRIIMNDESEHKFKIVRKSKIYDLALLKIDAKHLLPFKISDSRDIEIALDVYAVGTPTAEDLSQTISKGIISGIRKTSNNSKLIQTDASINSGNSGGALITKEGLVVGIVSSKLKGFSIEGVAFGIPAYELLDKLNVKIE